MCPEVGGEYSSLSGSARIVDVTCSLWSSLPIPFFFFNIYIKRTFNHGCLIKAAPS